jgi:DNA invertase Pin-like site-specific DNA recombinase
VGSGDRGNLRPGESGELTGVRREAVIFGFRTKVFVLAVLSSITSIARLLGLSRSTLYKYLPELSGGRATLPQDH